MLAELRSLASAVADRPARQRAVRCIEHLRGNYRQQNSAEMSAKRDRSEVSDRKLLSVHRERRRESICGCLQLPVFPSLSLSGSRRWFSTSGDPGSRQVNSLTETVASSDKPNSFCLRLQLLNGLGSPAFWTRRPIEAIRCMLLASERICEGWRPQHRNGQAPMPCCSLINQPSLRSELEQ